MLAGICLAVLLRDRTERDVDVASAWHPDSESGLRKTTNREIAQGEAA